MAAKLTWTMDSPMKPRYAGHHDADRDIILVVAGSHLSVLRSGWRKGLKSGGRSDYSSDDRDRHCAKHDQLVAHGLANSSDRRRFAGGTLHSRVEKPGLLAVMGNRISSDHRYHPHRHHHCPRLPLWSLFRLQRYLVTADVAGNGNRGGRGPPRIA